MAHVSKAIAVLAMAGAGVAFAQQGASGVRSWQVLGRAMQNERKITCKCLILCRDSMSSEMMNVWTEQSADGHLKLTVLGPLSRQGITSIDNGHEWITYRPDENRVMVEASPREEETERTTRNRLSLAERNYTLNVENDSTIIAGRKCYSLKAIAKHPEMPARIYGIDKEKGYLLRMEVVTRGESKATLDTKEIEFPRSIPDEDFELEPHDHARMVTYDAPLTISVSRETKQVVGFRPAVPQSLPYGFVVEAPQIVEGKNGKFIAVRITDGLVNATVYEWPDHKKGQKMREASSSEDRSVNGIKLQLKSEMPKTVEGGLLDCFVREALKKVESCLIRNRNAEPLDLDRVLNFEEETNRETGAEGKASDCYSNVYAIVLIDVE